MDIATLGPETNPGIRRSTASNPLMTGKMFAEQFRISLPARSDSLVRRFGRWVFPKSLITFGEIGALDGLASRVTVCHYGSYLIRA